MEHSLNVYDCLCDYLERPRVKELYGMNYTPETVAIVSLLHDVCKTGFYKKGTRNVKDANGIWQSVPVFEIDDKLPYGHGEKSVYIISGYMKLTREEAFAIRYHMGFSSTDDARNVSAAFEMFSARTRTFGCRQRSCVSCRVRRPEQIINLINLYSAPSLDKSRRGGV